MTVNLPKYDDFMLPTLHAVQHLGGSASIKEIEDALTEAMGLTQVQLDAAYSKSGALIAPDRMSWARSHLKIAGLLTSGGKGIWVLTDAGRDAANLTPAQLKAEVKKRSASHHAKIVAKREQARAAGISEEDQGDTAEPEWNELLLEQLKAMKPDAFERLAQRLLRESGFVKVEVTGKSGDGGIDGSGVLRMNLISFQVLFQCKRYKGSVASEVVRNFRGAMQGRADKGLIITTGTFTSEARKEATRDGAPAIDLIDGEALCELLKEKGLGVVVRPVITEHVVVVPEFFSEI
ncbi:restriction endonuclease [Sphingosinicella sp. BN140058]|uniref:restriction endonuclease n=1 Tax=Sphingosinicella sp. BN140058 TaxID=1892855 RepID=UPI00101266F6|nr:restriction endonuclease [Sphingosinicella sp. BN140058]QAY78686.1 restriction endonuclease [Sphingosinicella sp. BN140058]